jgi:pyridoxine 4-dehydrogenase
MSAPQKTIKIGQFEVNRLGFGALRLTGKSIFGEPDDLAEVKKILQRAVALGVTFIDTTGCYGPAISEWLIGEALAPYKAGLVIATKSGGINQGPNGSPPWPMIGGPEYIFQQVELSLRHLKTEAISLWQLHGIDPTVPIEESLGAAAKLQAQGKIKDIGLSNVSIAEIERARKIVRIVSVQNIYNIDYRQQDDVVGYCESEGLAFLPYFPMGGGALVQPDGVLDQAAKRHGATLSQLSIAWLLHRSPVMLPIPGTSSLGHLEENMKAADLALSDKDWSEIESQLK